MSAIYVTMRALLQEGLTKSALEKLLQDPKKKQVFEAFLEALSSYQQDSEEFYKDLVNTTYKALPSEVKDAIAASKPTLKKLYRGDEGKSRYGATSWSTSPVYAKQFGRFVYPFSALAGYSATIDTVKLSKLIKPFDDYEGMVGDDEDEVIVLGQRWLNDDPQKDYIWRQGEDFPADLLKKHRDRVAKADAAMRKRLGLPT